MAFADSPPSTSSITDERSQATSADWEEFAHWLYTTWRDEYLAREEQQRSFVERENPHTV